MITGSDFQSGEAVKRLRGEEATSTTTDRLSNLPDFIIYHILSFLDTKYAVQTSVLSRAWRSVWKHLDVLNLRRNCSPSVSSFAKLVQNVLSLRRQIDLRKVSFIDDEGPSRPYNQIMLDRVLRYAIAHNCQHLVIDLEVDYCYDFSLYNIFRSDSSGSLKTLVMRNAAIGVRFRNSVFPVLANLTMRNCLLTPDREGRVDLFSNFPSLVDLAVYYCSYSQATGYHCSSCNVTGVKIFAPQLVSLRFAAKTEYDIELVVPGLRYLYLEVLPDRNSSLEFSKLRLSSLPCLDRADIVLVKAHNLHPSKRKEVEYGWNCLFRGLQDANYVAISCYDDRVVKNLCEFLEQVSPPFAKLKSLFVYYDDGAEKVISYSLDRSSDGEAKHLRRR